MPLDGSRSPFPLNKVSELDRAARSVTVANVTGPLEVLRTSDPRGDGTGTCSNRESSYEMVI